MQQKKTPGTSMRIWHRYIGYFLAGIMTVYALSGIVLIFRDTNFLKKERMVTATAPVNASADSVGKAVKLRDLKFTKEEANMHYFQNGSYNSSTGEVKYAVRELPGFIKKLTQLHKASTKQPLFFLNVFFALSLLFFVLSSFWMYRPRTAIFKKGMIFTTAGIILTVILLWLL